MEECMIGIVSYPHNSKLQNYVQWVASRTVVINSPQFDLNQVQGVVWVGGSLETMPAPTLRTFLATLRKTFEHAVAKNKAGISFPIWGTCLGFQLLALIQSGSLSAVTNKRAQTVKFRASRMATAVRRLPNHSKTGTFRHNYSLRPPYPPYLRATSEGSDARGNYLTSFQFKNYPFYGVLWHPERPPPGGQQFSRQLADFFLRHIKT